MNLSKPINYWLFFAGRIIAGILVLGFLFIFNVFDFFCAPSTPRLSTGELAPNAVVTVTLDDNACHIPGCIEIKGTTETMKYSVAIGKGIKPCPVCINEDE